VYLRPDPATCLVQSQINTVVVQQFGIVSAAAFPPHATLVGNMRTQGTPSDLVTALDGELSRTGQFTIHNKGIERSGDGWVFNVHEDGKGAPNPALVDLAARVMGVLKPLALEHDDHLVGEFSPETFWGHLSLASHDLVLERHLIDEVGQFLQELPLEPPATFVADTVTLFEFSCDDWRAQWWRSLQWRHLHSWQLAEPGQR
jgi:hypothetical protein